MGDTKADSSRLLQTLSCEPSLRLQCLVKILSTFTSSTIEIVSTSTHPDMHKLILNSMLERAQSSWVYLMGQIIGTCCKETVCPQ